MSHYISQKLEYLFENRLLEETEAYELLLLIGKGEVNPSQLSSLLTVFRMRGITPAELTGFRNALLELCRPVDLSDFETIDLCGTGGDGKNTFNISTLSTFVVAGTGRKVAKHGNYGVSSGCGSSNVLESLGISFFSNSELLKKQMAETGICFLHAPLFHPAMKHVGGVRKELGFKTFFNLLGPLVNPARPTVQLSGVFSPELVRLYTTVLKAAGQRHLIVHALDGYDEVSLTGRCIISSDKTEELLRPEDFGLRKLDPEALAGGSSIKESCSIFRKIIQGEGTESQVDVVSANAGLALFAMSSKLELKDAVQEARESLLSGKAFQVLKEITEFCENNSGRRV